MKNLLIVLILSFLSLVSYAQIKNPPIPIKKIEIQGPRESFSAKMDRLNLKPRKYKLYEVCLSDGSNTASKKSHKKLSHMIRYFDRENKKTLSSENQYGTWMYGLNVIDENRIIVSGMKAVGMSVRVNYEFRRKRAVI